MQTPAICRRSTISARKLSAANKSFLYDGKLRTTVTSVRDGVVHVTAENAGILIKRKGMNLPDTDFGGDIITPKDRADLVYGSAQDIDYVALSFVQTADEYRKLRKLLSSMNSTAKIIAKIETGAAVENIEDNRPGKRRRDDRPRRFGS